MIRRSFRIGLWLGLLAGAGIAVSKIFRSKSDHSTAPPAWPPLEAAIPTPSPVPVAEPQIEPVVAAEEPGLILIGDEPLQEPEPEPVSKPVAKKPATKVAAPPKPAKPAAAAVAKPAPAKPAASAKKVAVKKKLAPWVDPTGTVCPKTHPVKGKLSSMIFQVPGNFAYDRTTPDRCYKSVDAAEDDGLRAAKR
ncbi:MAG: hypothetical protein QOH79_1751 [Acidimicrobiaceae bacterium]